VSDDWATVLENFGLEVKCSNVGGMLDSKYKLMTGAGQIPPSAKWSALLRRVWIGMICDFGPNPYNGES